MADQTEKTAAERFDAAEKERKMRLLRSAGIVTAIAAALVVGLLLIFTGEEKPASRPTPAVGSAQYAAPTAPIQTAAIPAPTTATPATTLYYGTAPLTTIPPATTVPATVSTTAAPAQPSETKAEPPQDTAAQFTSDKGSLTVDLSADNKFIRIVSGEKGISPALLTAVYALPDSGQNYVLEWNGETGADGALLRTADTVRRCYLIDTSGKITDIAAADFNECVGMNRIENSVAMETLIKKMLIPQIERAIN